MDTSDHTRKPSVYGQCICHFNLCGLRSPTDCGWLINSCSNRLAEIFKEAPQEYANASALLCVWRIWLHDRSASLSLDLVQFSELREWKDDTFEKIEAMLFGMRDGQDNVGFGCCDAWGRNAGINSVHGPIYSEENDQSHGPPTLRTISGVLASVTATGFRRDGYGTIVIQDYGTFSGTPKGIASWLKNLSARFLSTRQTKNSDGQGIFAL